MSAPVRVVLLEVPKLLREILEHAMRSQGDYELVRDVWRIDAVPGELSATPDVVILGLNAAEDATLVPALFARWPAAQVMTVMQSGGDAAVYELSPRRQPLAHMSPDEILVTLRDSVRRRRESARATS